MNEHVQNARAAARAYHEASERFDEAKDALMPYVKKQIEITRKVATEFGLQSNYDYRPYFYHDWVELEIGSYYQGASDTPAIECNLWYRGRCGDSDSVEGSFTLSEHILNDEPEKFEEELRAKLQARNQKKIQADQNMREQEIARLQAELNKLKGE